MHLCWIDRLRALSPTRNILCTGILLGVSAYVISIAPLLFSGQWRLAFQQPLLLIGAGTIWTLLFYLVCAQNYKQYLRAVTSALKHKEVNRYNELKSAHIKNLARDGKYFAASLSLWLVGALIIIGDMYGWLPKRIPSPLRGLPLEWRSVDQRPSRLAALILLGLFVSLLIWTTGWFIVSHSSFLARISRLRYIDSPYIYFLRLRPLIRINMVAAFSWSVGVSLVAYYFRHAHRPTLIISVLILQAVATYAFFLPTWLIQKKIRRIGLRRVRLLMSAGSYSDPMIINSAEWSNLLLLEDQIAKQTADPSFSMGLRYLGYLLTTIIIPLLTAIIGTLLTSLVDARAK